MFVLEECLYKKAVKVDSAQIQSEIFFTKSVTFFIRKPCYF